MLHRRTRLENQLVPREVGVNKSTGFAVAMLRSLLLHLLFLANKSIDLEIVL